MTLDARSLERLVPDDLDLSESTGGETYRLHVARYAFAGENARPGRLLDIACGVGYGTRLLAERYPGIDAVLGVDVSPEAIEYARKRYAGDGVKFSSGNAVDFTDTSGFDTIVTLETIEHIEAEPRAFLENLKRLLRPGGLVIASAPTTPSVDVNPHHTRDFTERSFRRLFRDGGFHEVSCFRQVQPVDIGSILRRSEKRLSGLRPHLPSYYATHPGAFATRLLATLRHGFSNRYITIVWGRNND